MRAVLTALATLVTVAGCRATDFTTIDIDADDEDIVIVAAGEATGRVNGVRLFRGAEGGAISAFWRPDNAMFVWVLSPQDFLRADGGDIEESLTELRAHTADFATGACKTCSAVADALPQVVNSGDSCPPPLGSGRAYDAFGQLLEPALADVARANVRLDWAGDCGCERREPQPATMSFTGVTSQQTLPALDKYAVSDDGVIFGLSDRFALRITSASDVVTRPLDGSRIDDLVWVPSTERFLALGQDSIVAIDLDLDLQVVADAQNVDALEVWAPDIVALLGRERRGLNGYLPVVRRCDGALTTCSEEQIVDCGRGADRLVQTFEAGTARVGISQRGDRPQGRPTVHRAAGRAAIRDDHRHFW